MNIETKRGAQVYTPLSLRLYDWWVLDISNSYAWQCKTRPVLLDHFQAFLGKDHMDIGVGTGFYLAQSSQQAGHLTLVDLNPSSLKAASQRVSARYTPECIEHDIFKPLPDRLNHRFDSVSLFYLLHCLPGEMAFKSAVIANAARTLKADGILYGATILGSGVIHNKFGRKLMNIYNKKGIFSNWQDSAEELKKILEASFRQVEIKICGTVALFSASQKIS
ncbi:class I SAM-dependent methyltransferase [Pantoea sp. C2G6]|uniref:class I SAM-dependent methyltransferase n=1 Tax=Pantoea sp. C2G6 TaxID=3243084 RepID=UPI003EDB4171